jgi:hypothetical protein
MERRRTPDGVSWLILRSRRGSWQVRRFSASHLRGISLASDITMRLISEFAAVEIARDDRGNGPRLMIRDMQTGQEIYLDPMELAALAWTRHEDLLPLLDPGRLEREDRT